MHIRLNNDIFPDLSSKNLRIIIFRNDGKGRGIRKNTELTNSQKFYFNRETPLILKFTQISLHNFYPTTGSLHDTK